MSTQEPSPEQPPQGTLFGHPTGLFTLFFAEMWERFSYYGMRALLIFYMIKGFLAFDDETAYAVYGAYGALVYAAPFIGGMLADRLLGARRAVILGGLLMAAGHLLMTLEYKVAFFTALALLICGNGFFKPNISTIVGGLYARDSNRKDAGFTIFYMGINLGAAMSPIICGYVGETYGWHYGFGLATIGMLIGVAVFVAPTKLTQMLILGGALLTAAAMPALQDTWLQLAVRIFMAAALTAAGIVAFVALNRGGLPPEAGGAPDPEALSRKVGGVLRADLAVLVGVALAVPVIALLVWRNEVAGTVLAITGVGALGYLLYEAVYRSNKVERERMFVVLVLMFFSMLFWAFFEQAGSSMNNFADRNIDRVFEERQVTEADVGSTIQFRISRQATGDNDIDTMPLLSQEQLGYKHGEDVFTISDLTKFRDRARHELATQEDLAVGWTLTQDHVGMGIADSEIPASEFQAANPIFILMFGLVFTALWGILGRRGLDPHPPFKFALGVLQLGLGFLVLWYGATKAADGRGMVAMSWLLLGYLLHTTGELCLSPVGLSMVTKLSPGRIVSTVMGAWFLVTGFSNYLAGLIATLTSVSHGKDGAAGIPPPSETVSLYGHVFGQVGALAIGAAIICFAISPLLNRWMHPEVNGEAETSQAETEEQG